MKLTRKKSADGGTYYTAPVTVIFPNHSSATATAVVERRPDGWRAWIPLGKAAKHTIWRGHYLNDFRERAGRSFPSAGCV